MLSAFGAAFPDKVALIWPRPPYGNGGGLATRFVPFAGVGTLIATGGLGTNGIIGFAAGAGAFIGAGLGAEIGAFGWIGFYCTGVGVF